MRRLTIALTIALLCSGCASLDRFNQTAAMLTSQAITASEVNRCSVHPAPCLSDAQFRDVNSKLHDVSVLGVSFTKLRIAGTATPFDTAQFVSQLAAELTKLQQAYQGIGWLNAVLEPITKLLKKATGLL